MFCDAHRTQQHAWQLEYVQKTVAGNRSTTGSENHHQQYLPEVATTNKEKPQSGQQSKLTEVSCPQFQVQKQRTDPPIT